MNFKTKNYFISIKIVGAVKSQAVTVDVLPIVPIPSSQFQLYQNPYTVVPFTKACQESS
ncbi:MAG: hypothetical protein LBQ24_01805 [Candidatus Peribacteria bacterium]|nr:hypothetical protein [Candidatus Peribacteria bacterium]